VLVLRNAQMLYAGPKINTFVRNFLVQQGEGKGLQSMQQGCSSKKKNLQRNEK
jgi:hypothetical protein